MNDSNAAASVKNELIVFTKESAESDKANPKQLTGVDVTVIEVQALKAICESLELSSNSLSAF